MIKNNLMIIMWFSILIFIVGCSQSDQSRSSAHASANVSADGSAVVAPVNIKVEKLVPQRMVERVSLLGQTNASKEVTYSAEVAGRLEALTVDLGSHVKKGQLLARVDYQMLKARADQAQASYDLTRKTYDRLIILKNEELVTQQQIDEVDSQRIQAEAVLSSAMTNLRQSSIRATMDGVVSAKFVELGEYVGPGTPIVTVVDYSKIYVEAQIPERRAPYIRRESPVTVLVDALGESFSGMVDVIVPQSDPVTKTYLLRVKVDNPDLRIMVGMSATLNIEVRVHPEALVVSQDVVLEQNSGRAVFVAEDGIARRREVKLGPITGHDVLIQEGLHAGDQVIVVGQRNLVDGQPVRIIES